jgi:hypothetical protein
MEERADATRPRPALSDPPQLELAVWVSDTGSRDETNPASPVPQPPKLLGARLISRKRRKSNLGRRHSFVPFSFYTTPVYPSLFISPKARLAGTLHRNVGVGAAVCDVQQPKSTLQVVVHPALDKAQQTPTCHFSPDDHTRGTLLNGSAADRVEEDEMRWPGNRAGPAICIKSAAGAAAVPATRRQKKKKSNP